MPKSGEGCCALMPPHPDGASGRRRRRAHLCVAAADEGRERVDGRVHAELCLLGRPDRRVRKTMASANGSVHAVRECRLPRDSSQQQSSERPCLQWHHRSLKHWAGQRRYKLLRHRQRGVHLAVHRGELGAVQAQTAAVAPEAAASQPRWMLPACFPDIQTLHGQQAIQFSLWSSTASPPAQRHTSPHYPRRRQMRRRTCSQGNCVMLLAARWLRSMSHWSGRLS